MATEQPCNQCGTALPPVLLIDGACNPCRVHAEEAEIEVKKARKAGAKLKTAAESTVNKAAEAAARELALRELARRRFLPFIRRFHPEYMAGWFHIDVCERLERFMADVEAKKSPRLMIFAPPRHGKSQAGSKTYPAWVLGHHPDWEIMSCAYSATLAERFSRALRSIMRDERYHAVFQTRLDPDTQSVSLWETTEGGGLMAAGVGGPITGSGAHIMLIDDPIKNREEAESASIRQSIKDWYTSTAYTRLAPGGGVLIIQCMTGDTQVLMADGTERRLDELQVGDQVATYDEGRLTTSSVRNWKSNGRDSCYRITTSSGNIGTANTRHPFLVYDSGELKWTRLGDLRTGQKIVTLRGSGESGEARRAAGTDVTSQCAAGGCAPATTRNRSGLTATALRLLGRIHHLVSPRSSSIVMGLRSLTTSGFWKGKAAAALCAGARHMKRAIRHIGAQFSASTTATRQAKCEGCSATIATSPQATQRPQNEPPQWPSTSDFTLTEIVAIDYVGEEEVFDVQIDRTENFIANGLVSHNTRWHDDDLSGWLIKEMQDGTGDVWEVVEYPAIALVDEPYRKAGEPLHPERYDLDALLRIKNVLPDRDWWALYQQKPIADEGAYFTRDMFDFYFAEQRPKDEDLVFYDAWDFAIGQKDHNDWTVGLCAGLDRNGDLWLVDRDRGKYDGSQIVEHLIDFHLERRSQITGLEKGMIEMSIGPFLERRIAERKAWTLYTHELKTRGRDKIARARAIQGMAKQGKVHLPHPSECDWVEDFLAELLRFPSGVHDDQVDAFAWLGQMITEMSAAPTLTPPKKKSWKDRLDEFVSQDEKHKSYMAA